MNLKKKDLSKNTLRKFVFITLTHAELREREVSKIELFKRVKSMMECQAIVMATETHKEGGYHYHIVAKTKRASKNNALREIRDMLPEFEGRQCNIKFPKGWGNILAYITKEDKDPLVWGEFSKEQILEIARSATHKRKCTIDSTAIMNELEECKKWWDVYDNPIIRERLLHNYTNMKKIYEDFEYLKELKTTLGGRIMDFLLKHDWPFEYSPEYLKEKYVLLDWIACQLVFRRPIKTKQLFIYGEPSVQKTLIFNMLSQVLRIYFASSRKGDFAGADNLYDLWLFDEFHEPEESSYYGVATDTGTAFANTLLKVLDGQECRLDSKYSKIFTKKCHVPIVMIGNTLPKGIKTKGPLQERFIRLRFANVIEHLDESRLIATLWGCIKRRVERQLSLERTTKNEFLLKYNNVKAYSLREEIPEHPLIHNNLCFTYDLEYFEIVGFLNLQDTKQEKNTKGRCMHIQVLEDSLNGNLLSTLNFAIIPLQKAHEFKRRDSLEKIQTFKTNGTHFHIHRFKLEKKPDYMVWPLNAESEEKENNCNVLLEVLQEDHLIPSMSRPENLRSKRSLCTLNLGPRGTGYYKEEWDEND